MTVRAVSGLDAGQFTGEVARALERAGVPAPQVSAVALRHTGIDEVDRAQHDGLAAALPGAVRVTDEQRIGDCYSAHALLQLAGLLDAGTLPAVVVAADPDGLLSIAVLKGLTR
ncbi:hypothetical protein G3M53_63725 [Streptomyces sp. SID7982]|nr:hypothetical protein [Streptomyces sp. SID7982]